MAEREVRWQGLARQRLDYVVQPVVDIASIRSILAPRVEYTAYALGQLEPALFPRTRWYYARGTTGTGLVLHSRGGLGDATFVLGDPDAVSAILSIHPGTAQTYATCQPQHLDTLRRYFRLANQQPMIRMAVTRERFEPVVDQPTAVLSGIDIRKVNALYGSEGGPSYYIPEHIDSGVYRGVVEEGRLVAIAGTHVVSRQEGVAVVGNVFTHPDYRGKGYATATTSAVTETLLKYCDHVVLTVDPNNTPAVAAYARLGYREVCQLVEASAARRDPSGLGSSLRRFRAAIRGRKYDGSLVTLHD
ncbi:MAG TPA: GNAT family N-acetyltransferase [Tepidiformaceae bacterium]|nr:GNAT family N-acetyltransferase [Tepidiformaceae bacterium]